MKTLSAEPEALAKAIAGNTAKPRHKANLIASWQQARQVKQAREDLAEERVRNAKLGASFNDCLAEAKAAREAKLHLDVAKEGGWGAWGRKAAELENVARELDVRANVCHQEFSVSCGRIQELQKLAGESNAAHENLRRRLEQDARIANAAVAKLLEKEQANAAKQSELEKLEAPPV